MHDNTLQKERLPFIDTAKGILIIFMVMGHIVNLASDVSDVSQMEYITSINVLFVPYFMQAFFFITGFCSSFNKDCKTFIVTNSKSILIPYVTFCIINQFVRWGFFHEDFFFCTEQGKQFFFLVELYWFLAALFIAKMAYFALSKLTDNLWIGGGIITVFFLGAVYLNGRHVHSYNYFHWHNALCNLPFLWLGQVFKRYDMLNRMGNRIYILVVIYLSLVITFLLADSEIPSYSHYPHFYWQQIHYYLLFAITGTMMTIALSKIVTSNRLISFFGQNSLIVYGAHFAILGLVQLVLVRFLVPSGRLAALVFYVLSLTITLLISYQVCIVFQKKPFKYFIGKF